MSNLKTLISILFIAFSIMLNAQGNEKSWKKITQSKEERWFGSEEALSIADNVLLYQRDIGGWPKNTEMQKPLTDIEKQKLLKLKSDPDGCTTDNGATCQEMLFLSKIYKQTPDNKYKEAFERGLNYLLEAQYENGGWPQFYPLKKGYYTHITYNDDSMVNILNLLKEVKDNTGFYSISFSDEMQRKASKAFEKGIDCILKTQYVQNGVLTAWCAQHDEFTFLPAKARAYELPSLSGKESAQIVLLLMSVKNPSKQIIQSVDAAVLWFEKTKIEGIKIVDVQTTNGKKTDKKVVESAGADPLWARFMELDNNKPFFCDRDGIKQDSLSKIGYERRSGYAWYTNEPKDVLKKYTKWRQNLK